ncbi:triose-phosphate isomerase [Nannocystis sp. RBIL2]|uniref:triose-phosphate isomerase n=1 Tax=Nannocystis sp. RBIL2 TaxID=2996788 RepID=UPI002271CE04|nr:MULTISPECIES: triose-phosphate isomerase [unclassified Nannocystis]MCY1068780.1 triose-phosphate isomerase [Nannocystis sp. RBIL2]
MSCSRTGARDVARVRWTIGNWKQNLFRGTAELLATEIVDGLPPELLEGPVRTKIGVSPTLVALEALAPWSRPAGPLYLFGQNCAAQEEGAFTGEVGPGQLADVGAHGAILGHSERRAHFHEDDALIARKVQCALQAGLRVVLCVGEGLEIRESGEHENYVISQLSASLAGVDPELFQDRLIIAYEPVWAIGTSKTASARDAGAMHRRIRTWLTEQHGATGADRSILYGGSVKPGNAAGLMAAGDVDGFLVGGASLEAEAFLQIIRLVAEAS